MQVLKCISSQSLLGAYKQSTLSLIIDSACRLHGSKATYVFIEFVY